MHHLRARHFESRGRVRHSAVLTLLKLVAQLRDADVFWPVVVAGDRLVDGGDAEAELGQRVDQPGRLRAQEAVWEEVQQVLRQTIARVDI